MANELLPLETRCAECGSGVSLTRCYADWDPPRALCEKHWKERYIKECIERGHHRVKEWLLLSDGSVLATCYCGEENIFHGYRTHEEFLSGGAWKLWPRKT